MGELRAWVKAAWRRVNRFQLYGPLSVLVLAILSLWLLARWNARPDVITALVAIVTLGLSQTVELARRRSEERRWYAERFLADRIEALRRLYPALDDWHRAVNEYGNIPPSSIEEFRTKVGAKEEPFLLALSFGQIYLASDDDQAIRECMSALRRANIAIYHSLPDSAFPAWKPRVEETLKVVPWVDLVTRHRAATGRLANLLNPMALRDIEAELRARGQ